MQASIPLNMSFILLPLVVAGFWIIGSLKFISKKFALAAALTLGLVMALTALLTQGPWIHQFSSFPPPALRLLLAILILCFVLAATSPGKKLSNYIPLPWLVLLQTQRIIIELMLSSAYLQGLAPIHITYHGYNFDSITGISALLLGIWAIYGKPPRSLIFVWNILGMVFLCIVLTLAILSMPHPLQKIFPPVPNVWITYFPFIWLPAVLVSSALFGHLLIFRKVRKNHWENKF